MDRTPNAQGARNRKELYRASARASKRGDQENHTKNGGVDDSRSIVNSLSKGLRVLEAFTAERSEMTLSEVARTANIDPGTAFRMLNTLVMLGYVARIPESRRFRLTLKVVDLGLHAIGRSDLRELARPVLRSLVGEISEAASVGVLDGADILYVERVRAGLTRLGVDIRIGTNIPAVSGVIGHAILAFLPLRELDRILDMPPRRGELAVNRMNKAELRAVLRTVRRQGYALQDSAFGNGLRILAAPVLDVDGYPVASVSVAAPAIRVSMDEFRARALEPVRNAAGDIARAVQASGTVSTAV
ncbi:MAG: helix-turn-helix domain-containing protein [Rhizobiales bacterium]|nr:helix-turn-helix domain-containing protein [Hyphomicrobiales bacterium]